MPKRLKNTATERVGVNYVRSLFEAENCIFKEIHKEHDYGHDAYVILVDNEKVLPTEIALQIKSGKSYVEGKVCYIPSTQEQRDYWSRHPLPCFGIVYDPEEECAYHTNLKDICWEMRGADGHKTISFEKQEWNKLDQFHLKNVWLPLLLSRPPTITVQHAERWLFSSDSDESYLGVLVLRHCFGDQASVWGTFFEAFERKKAEDIPLALIYTLAHIPWHPDIFARYKNGFLPEEARSVGKKRIKNYSKQEIIKLLSLVDENGFERGSIGQNCGAIIVNIDNYEEKLQEIVKDDSLSDDLKYYADALVNYREQLPF